jgi:hypothetical protein
MALERSGDLTSPPVARVSLPASENEIAGGDTRATNACPERGGHRVTYLPVDREGLLKLANLEAAITDQTAVCGRSFKRSAIAILNMGFKGWGL